MPIRQWKFSMNIICMLELESSLSQKVPEKTSIKVPEIKEMHYQQTKNYFFLHTWFSFLVIAFSISFGAKIFKVFFVCFVAIRIMWNVCYLLYRFHLAHKNGIILKNWDLLQLWKQNLQRKKKRKKREKLKMAKTSLMANFAGNLNSYYSICLNVRIVWIVAYFWMVGVVSQRAQFGVFEAFLARNVNLASGN